MQKKQIFILLLVMAALGGISYYFLWKVDKDESDSTKPRESETESGTEMGTLKPQVIRTSSGPKQASQDRESFQTKVAEKESAETANPSQLVQGGQSHILKLIEGAKLLGESTLTDVEGDKTVRVYDVGDRFKYPKVRVETLHGETDADSMTAMVADHLIVRVKDPTIPSEYLREELSELGLTIRRELNTKGHYLVTLGTDEAVQITALLESVHKRLGEAVEVAEPDFIVFTTANMPDDVSFDQLWGMHNTGQNNGVVDADIDAPEAWDQSTGSQNILVAVIDTGVDYNHPDLAANMWMNPDEIDGDGIDNDGNGFIDDLRGWDFYSNDSDPIDTHGHGTHVSGTIGAVGNNGTGVVGVNWEVSILALRFLGPNGGSTSDGIECINYATQIGVDLSSNSWGGGGYSQLLKDAIAAAGEANQLFVAAAGNDGMNIENYTTYPAGYTFDDAIDNIISVASTDRNNDISYFSNYAATKVDLGAPGSNIYSTTPNNSYSTYSGTSMATPHVAGACALYLSLNSDVDFQAVKRDLLETTVPILALDGKCRSGGVLNLNDFISRADASPVRVQSLAMTGSIGLTNYFSPGETVVVNATYKNLSNALVGSVVSELSTSAPGVNFEVSRIDFSNVQAGGVIEPETAFSFTIPESFETPGIIDLEIQTVISAFDASVFRLRLQVFEEAQVTGTISDASTNIEITGAVLALSGPINQEVLSDADGSYSMWTIAGDYSLDVSKPGYSSQRSDFTTPVSGSIDFVLTQPQLEVDQPELNIELFEGESREITLALSNRGNGNLEWVLERGGVISPNGQNSYSHHTNEPYTWTDISGVGTRIPLDDDTNFGPVELGFDFLFYGQTFSDVRVCSNGFLSFTSSAAPYYNMPLDSGLSPANMIAFFWDDLYFTINGSYANYYRNASGQMVFQFDNAKYYRVPNALFSAQVILSPDGTTQIYYKEIGYSGSATIGLRGSGTSDSHQVSYNDNFARNLTSLTFEPILLGRVVGDTSGTLGSDVHNLTLRIDSGALAPGTYQDTLSIETNEGDGIVFQVPVTVKVLAAPVLEIKTQEFLEQTGYGDGDSVPEVGEKLDLNLILENTGMQTALAQNAKIFGGDSHIELLQSESLYPEIPSGGKATNQTPFVVRINPAAPFGHEANFQLRLFDENEEETESIAFTIQVQYQEQVNGSVKVYETNRPLVGASVSVGEKTVRTDELGEFIFNFDAPGIYTIVASAQGFISEEKGINLADTEFLEFEMKNPRLRVSPRSYGAVVYKGNTHDGNIHLSNIGRGPLEWEITSGDTLAYRDPVYNLAMDTPYVWNDISELGERISFTNNDDGTSGPHDLGFSFEFYDKSFEQIRICSNGFINFANAITNYFNWPLTSPYVYEDYLIAFFWDDLYFYPDSRAFIYRINNEQCIVQFDNVGYYRASSLRFSAQVVLKSDGSITMYYKEVDSADEATIGIRGNYTRDHRAVKQVAYNEAVIGPETALTLTSNIYEFGSITSPLSGSINHETDIIKFTIDSSQLQLGYYRDFLVLTTNQVGHKTRVIPIELRIYQNALYEQFLEKYNVPRHKWGVREDSDLDGRSNILEFAFGLDPTSNDGDGGLNLVSIASTINEGSLNAQNNPSNQNALNFEYRRRIDTAGLNYLLQSSDSLDAEWLTIDSPNEATSPTSDPAIEKVQVTVPIESEEPNKFYRIQVIPE
jgi:subtilisin family serine protease/uncharacterized membrane protein